MSKRNHTAGRPYMFAWLFTIQDDPSLSRNAKTAAVPIFRHANLNTGKGCYVGAETAARETGASRNTILRGWRELAEAGYLNVWEPNRGSGKGADRWARFPSREVQPSEGSSAAPRGLVEAEGEAQETRPDLTGQVSKATDRDAVNGEPERARDLGLHAAPIDPDARPCLDCGKPTGWRYDDVCPSCRNKIDRNAAAEGPPIGHRDDWELRNA